MPNANVNKVVLGNETLLDLTRDTVTPEDVSLGKTFHLASGAQAVGTSSIEWDTEPTEDSTNGVTSGGVYTALTGKADASHTHDAGNIQSGTLSLARGGTGVDASAQYGYRVFGSTNNGTPRFRSLVADEIPTLGTGKIDGVWPVTKGGTGVDSSSTAKNRFFASPYGSAGDPTFRAIHSSDIPTLSPTKSGFQGGTVAISSVNANSGADTTITFSPAFSSVPIVIVGMSSSQTAYTGQCSAYAMSVTKTGFTLRRQNNYTSARNIGAHWMAFEL